MRKELDEQLCRKYPSLYRDRHGDMRRTLMCWGFSCGDGWYTLIDVISELLTKHNPQAHAMQVKEKSGSLCFYHHGCDDYSLGVQMTAETLSQYICEICGAPALLNNDGGWSSTRCKEHASEYSVNDDLEEDIDISSVADLGLGAAWSRLALILKQSADWHTEKNGRPAAAFFINKSKTNGQLAIRFSGGDEMTAGMVDIIAGYANRIDERTGLIVIE
ncbi:hypothetical protein [Methylobacter sp. BlB1]|uniref:hypothetical protein n=1 Tax=Methylobacter sp. BlB1 TaxID=2785914 RepID=UPI0018961A6E|nr:hypothetical protein [Methylobacter sp. BlB1]MBF6650418.1 hypothetical protein [Methylobacter sp. BlB1]